jgi:hypothetical protein
LYEKKDVNRRSITNTRNGVSEGCYEVMMKICSSCGSADRQIDIKMEERNNMKGKIEERIGR